MIAGKREADSIVLGVTFPTMIDPLLKWKDDAFDDALDH
jgi:hypothetical protein